MSDRLKRILFIAFFIVFSIGIGGAIYMYFFRPVPAPTPVVPPEELGGALPGAGEGAPGIPGEVLPPGALPSAEAVPGAVAPTPVSELQTVILNEGISNNVSLSSDGRSARYYSPEDSKFYKVNADGLITALSDQTFPSVESVSWGHTRDQAILSFPDGSNIYYDFASGKQKTLPQHWNDFDFSPDDKNIVAKSDAVAPESRFLIVADPDGSNPRAIEPLGNNSNKTFPVWTDNKQIIAYATVGEAKGFDRQEIIMIGQNHENFKGLLVEGRGFTPLWSPTGRQIVYSVWNAESGFRPELWTSGGSAENMNQNRIKLGIQTWADKCVWANETTLYCGVPSSLPSGAGLERSLFTNTVDNVMKIDLATGEQIQLGSPGTGLSVTNPVIVDEGRYLMFRDAATGGLYRFRLF
ncbi:hypothetical protein KJZ71_04545 [Patescibacteria group bacterium]|nr:hypothetical protein [Patescibacteria group bacterium]MDL1953495.1 hypothetical protein [Candidatus Uhrbacteria bacterium UHB]RIL00580.1 MAG: hypothetical protein DCC77_03420 [Candidatus Uhrbacteria bacterium]